MRIAALVLALVLCACSSAPELPQLARVPEFSLVDQTGATRHARDFDGKVWVAAFVFTRCTSICPMLTAQMVNFRRRLGAKAADVPFVAFSVDPDFDTPEVLARYASERGATRGFTFLTGDSDAIQTVAREGFLAAVGSPTQQPGGGVDVIHSQHLLLVDRERRLRGFYRTDAEGLDALERDVEALSAER